MWVLRHLVPGGEVEVRPSSPHHHPSAHFTWTEHQIHARRYTKGTVRFCPWACGLVCDTVKQTGSLQCGGKSVSTGKDGVLLEREPRRNERRPSRGGDDSGAVGIRKWAWTGLQDLLRIFFFCFESNLCLPLHLEKNISIRKNYNTSDNYYNLAYAWYLLNTRVLSELIKMLVLLV